MNISIDRLTDFIRSLMLKYGMTPENAAAFADVYRRATLRGVGHHDIYDIPSRLKQLDDGKVTVNPVYRPIHAFGGIESWDADNGLGELGCTFAMERAMALADVHGIGLCAARNTNHFLASAPYIQLAAEQGYIAVLLAKASVSMGAPGTKKLAISQLPMGFAYPTDGEYPVMLDICLAYASFGQLMALAKEGKSVPDYWGFDPDGNPTTDPAALGKGVRLPIGGHKGFGLAMLGEILTGVMSSGCVLDERTTPDGVPNQSAHTAIAVKADALFGMDEFHRRAGDLSKGIKELSQAEAHIPGEGSYAKSLAILKNGLDLDDAIVVTLGTYAEKFGLAPL